MDLGDSQPLVTLSFIFPFFMGHHDFSETQLFQTFYIPASLSSQPVPEIIQVLLLHTPKVSAATMILTELPTVSRYSLSGKGKRKCLLQDLLIVTEMTGKEGQGHCGALSIMEGTRQDLSTFTHRVLVVPQLTSRFQPLITDPESRFEEPLVRGI